MDMRFTPEREAPISGGLVISAVKWFAADSHRAQVGRQVQASFELPGTGRAFLPYAPRDSVLSLLLSTDRGRPG